MKIKGWYCLHLGLPLNRNPTELKTSNPLQGSGVKFLRNGEIQQAGGAIVVLLCADFTWHLGLHKCFLPRKTEKFCSSALCTYVQRLQGWCREMTKWPKVTYSLWLPLWLKTPVCPASPRGALGLGAWIVSKKCSWKRTYQFHPASLSHLCSSSKGGSALIFPCAPIRHCGLHLFCNVIRILTLQLLVSFRYFIIFFLKAKVSFKKSIKKDSAIKVF